MRLVAFPLAYTCTGKCFLASGGGGGATLGIVQGWFLVLVFLLMFKIHFLFEHVETAGLVMLASRLITEVTVDEFAVRQGINRKGQPMTLHAHWTEHFLVGS